MSTNPTPSSEGLFTTEQKEYLEGVFAGTKVRGQSFPEAQSLPTVAPVKRTKEEKIKEALPPFDAYGELRRQSLAGLPPETEDIFRFKWNGLFWLAPVHDGYMCRLRIPGGFLTASQFRELGRIAIELASGFLQITTRNNLQIRIIPPQHTVELLRRVVACGLHSRGAGADNIRNITAHPTTGIDPYELVDVKPLVADLQAVIMNDGEFYDLPRKFNISLNGGGLVPVAEDTNDIGLRAFAWSEDDSQSGSTPSLPPGIYFQVLLGGVTGHQEWAEHSGVVCTPGQAVEVCAAMTKVFARNGNRGNRGKARLVYLLKEWGFEKFIEESGKLLGYSLARLDEKRIPEPMDGIPEVRHAHLGAHPQKQPGLSYLGVSTPVGLIQENEVSALARVAEEFGTGEIRLTIFQSVLIPHIPTEKIPAAVAMLEETGLMTEVSRFRGGMVACTGNRYCKGHRILKRHHVLPSNQNRLQRLRLGLESHRSAQQHRPGSRGGRVRGHPRLLRHGQEHPHEPHRGTRVA